MAGPRHIAFHPRLPYAYGIDDLRSTMTAYHWDARRGGLRARQILSSTAPTTTGDSRGGEIAVSPDGPESDTIGVFRASARTGLLRPVEWTSTGGIRPRFFHTVVAFDIDATDGRLTPTGGVAPAPPCACSSYGGIRRMRRCRPTT